MIFRMGAIAPLFCDLAQHLLVFNTQFIDASKAEMHVSSDCSLRCNASFNEMRYASGENKMSHPIRRETAAPSRRGNAGPPHWPSYTGASQFVGVSPSGRVTVYVDPTLGEKALKNAEDLINDADRVVAANDAIFGTSGGPVSVILFALSGATDGTGGADHMGCDYTTGEALSRWCAATTSSNALDDFATAPQWASNGMPDFVNHTEPTDQKANSTGCGMAFLSWLMSQGYDLGKIAPAMVSLGDTGTLAQLYQVLTGKPSAQALPAFMAAVKSLKNGVTADDPFKGASHPTSITRSRGVKPVAVCSTKSHRLLHPRNAMR